ncbi:SusC/RagA family TonB-linked outer membrane protein [Sphingobacterium faecale]|uniref:SusC/RagA family TonB-linked outer membrane protein n=1 Tax=Sphingobacterium faecale TaxID=2803775 RepID=A0ABS1R9V3_9SPHI|nr:SusC/RagA family TonB-linked outer membrane protein [Sphingobacterium faecale]MBL1411481.1 SusC/RagA family TonB-linked outer membrane protein [Sphingobacterium faecale]
MDESIHYKPLVAYFISLLAIGLLAFLPNIAYAQTNTVTIQSKNRPLAEVLKNIGKQTGYFTAFSVETFRDTKPVTIQLKGVPLEQALKQLLQEYPVQYEIKDRTIIIKPRAISKKVTENSLGARIITGRVMDSIGNPISKVTVKAENSGTIIFTDISGQYSLALKSDDTKILFSSVGYQTEAISTDHPVIDVVLKIALNEIAYAEVVNTGYQQLPKERATGSFSTVSNERFNQQVGTDILSRLPAIANSVVMDVGRSQGKPQMMVRGLSTINGPKDPLIVLDNFPYDGDLNNINPNIVENITILKDAAASSIWGARAANGVIVITTKKGNYNRPTTVDMNSNLTIEAKPDLYYIPQMNGADFIDVEMELYKRGFYKTKINSASKPVLSPVIDLLDLADKGQVDEQEALAHIDSWRGIDARDQFDRLVYKPASKQQYYLNASGGSSKFSWLSAVGYDRNIETLGNTYNRMNLRFQNTYQVTSKLSLATNLYYTQSDTRSGRGGYTDLGDILPYMRIADESGHALAVPKGSRQSFLESFGGGQLLDWNYYPLTDWKYKTKRGTTSDLLGTVELHYEIISGLKAAVNYQYERQQALGSTLADVQSYEARDYVNRFTQLTNGQVKYIVPKGGILDKSNAVLVANNIRGVFSYDKNWNWGHISAIAGGEMRDGQQNSYNDRFYGYNPNNLTFGNVDYTEGYPSVITGAKSTIQNMQSLGDKTTRFVSQFANVAYSYEERYTVSASVRRDASNLFGLKTNDQWNPFWSAGFAWKLSNERFYKSELVPYLNIRATYGFSGNVDPAMVAVSTVGFGQASPFTGITYARYTNFYNPLLKWETSKMLNLGLDFRSKGNRLTGSIEYYRKKGDNLFGQAPVDLTTGVLSSMKRNVASMYGHGLDLELTSRNIDGNHFKWSSTLNFSLYKDAIEEYLLDRTMAQLYVNMSTPPISGIKGHPVYTMYAYKWGGLDPNNGEAQGYLNGELSKDYAAITGTGTAVEDLEYYGSAIPTRFGNFSNSFSYHGINLQVGITYKLGYWFRRESINYTSLFNNGRGHSDYSLRWQNPGDETHTDVPVNPYTTNSNRDRFYEGANILIEKADHVRLQYIRLGYNLSQFKRFKNLELYVNLQDLGLLWKANKKGIDPDFSLGRGRIVKPSTCSLGIRAKI